jgi:hypothetical protein
LRHSIGIKDGSIIATIITTHMPRNDAAGHRHLARRRHGPHQTIVIGGGIIAVAITDPLGRG